MEYRFDINVDEMTVEDMLIVEDVQDGKRPIHGMTDLMARYMTDDTGLLLGVEASMQRLRPLKMKELTTIAQAFGEAIQRKAVPPTISAP
jgi:hypothetical protein